MAAPSKILSLNLGMQTVALAEFSSTSGGGLVLNRYRLTELLADPATDSSRVSQVKMAVQEMVDAFKIKSGKVNYSIPSQSVFTRFVKLPPMEEGKIDQVINFEAQQNVPFPINEVVWDYQIVGDGKDGKMEVVLVAIKSDLLNEINSAVEDSGITTSVVDVGPMALCNAYRYNYSDLTGCTLLIDIGARTTNLIFIEAQKVFSRSISIGGTTITSAIARDFGESFGEAEARKKKVGFVSLGGNYAEPSDPDVSRVSKVIRNTMTRLHAEISRSISFYRSQQQGSQPVRGFLCGAATNLPYMSEFFHEKLNMPIEFLNPLRNVAVGSGVQIEDASKNAHILGELVGLSLREVSDCPMELSLQPQSVVRAQEMASKRPKFLIAGVCILLALVGWLAYYWNAAKIENTVINNTLNPQVQSLQELEGKFASLRKEAKAAQETAMPFLQAIEERDAWLKIMDDINARLPDHFIWVTSFEPVENNPRGGGNGPRGGGVNNPRGGGTGGGAQGVYTGVKIRGLYLNNEPKQAGVIDDFLQNLSQSPYFSIDLNKRQDVNPVRSSPNSTEWAYEYELHLNLKKPVGAQ
jgi:type IV pilus assembly protein PilM